MKILKGKVMKTEYVYRVMVGSSNYGIYDSIFEAVVVFEDLCLRRTDLVSLHRIVKKL